MITTLNILALGKVDSYFRTLLLDAFLPPNCGRDDARLLRSLHWMPPSRHTAVEVDARSAAFNISASEVQPRGVC